MKFRILEFDMLFMGLGFWFIGIAALIMVIRYEPNTVIRYELCNKKHCTIECNSPQPVQAQIKTGVVR